MSRVSRKRKGDCVGTVIATPEPGFLELLEQIGARPAGLRRRDCPDCGGKRTVAVDEERALFYCHHAGCNFHGGVGALRKRLGLRREWLPRSEYLRQQRERERTHEAARRLEGAVRSRRRKLLDSLRELDELATLAPDAAPTEVVWARLSSTYRQRSTVLAELAILENWSARDMVSFLLGTQQGRKEAIDDVLSAGGLYGSDGRFVEVPV